MLRYVHFFSCGYRNTRNWHARKTLTFFKTGHKLACGKLDNVKKMHITGSEGVFLFFIS